MGSLRLRSNSASAVQFYTEAGGAEGHIYYDQTSNNLEITNFNSGFISFKTADLERGRWDSSGRFLVGTSSARTNFYNGSITSQTQVEYTGGTFTAGGSYIYNENNTSGGELILAKTRSGSIGGTTIVQSGDTLGTLTFQGSDGTEFVVGAEIRCLVDGTPGANDMPGRIVLSTTPDGSASPVERVRIANDGFVSFAGNTTTGIRVPASNELAIRANGTDAVRVLSNQRVAVGGTTSAFNLVTIQSNAAGLGAFGLVDTSGDNVNRNLVHFARNADSTGNIVGTISTTNTATSYNTSSDYRLKENVVPLTGAADRLKQIPVHRFNFIADPDKTVDGFIAHEAQAVVPECVTGTKDEVDEDGNPVYQGIDQSKLVPLLAAALQEALAEIKSLKARVTALEP